MCSSKSTSSTPTSHLSADLLDYVLPAPVPHCNMHLRILLSSVCLTTDVHLTCTCHVHMPSSRWAVHSVVMSMGL